VSTNVPITNTQSSSECFVLVRENGRTRPAVVCSSCGATQSHGSTPGVPANTLANNFRKRGWEIDRRHRAATCPACLETIAMKLSPDAIRATHKLFELLEQHYDQERRRYREAWTDAAMAKECGLATDVVATHREALYGPMVSPALLEAEAELDAVQQKLEALVTLVRDEYGALRDQLGKLAAKVQGALR